MLPEYSSSPLNESGDVELQQLLERDSNPEDSEEAGSPGIAPSQDSAVAIGITRRLFISHFLSTWNSRVFEFGAVLFIAKIFPGTLLPVSVYAVVRSTSAIGLSPMVGRYIDVSDRLKVVRSSIVGQRLSVAVSCLVFWTLLVFQNISTPLRILLLVILALLACIEKLGSTMNTLAVERDWVVVIAGAVTSDSALQALNSQMRRIDLFCKLLGPLFISLIDGFATKMAIFVTLGLSVASVGIEYWAIAQIYQKVPALQFSNIASNRERQNSQESRVGETGQSRDNSVAYFGSNLSDVKLYFHHRDFLPSMALSLLYLTVLSFAGQMVTYLSAVGYSSTQIGLIRTVSVAFEISATWLGPVLMIRVGVIRAGLWSISWQLFCIAAAVALFWMVEQPFIAASGLIIGVVGSRVGLWVFDLCVQEIVQEEVEADRRGSFSSTEASFQNLFELGSYASTIFFARPAQFRYPVLLSAAAVFMAGALYTKFVRDRRGHLLHMSNCLKGRALVDRYSRLHTASAG